MTKMSLLTFDEALQKLLAAARPVAEIEEVESVAAAGRTLAHAQASGITVPPLDNSAMDGYAVRVTDIPAARMRLPVSQRIPAGSVGTPLQPGTAARIFTGAPVPEGADAVVMQELCEHAGEGVVLVNHVPRHGENIRRAGEDIQAGAGILAAGTRLAPQDIGLAASVGLATLPVFRRLRVGLGRLSAGFGGLRPGLGHIDALLRQLQRARGVVELASGFLDHIAPRAVGGLDALFGKPQPLNRAFAQVAGARLGVAGAILDAGEQVGGLIDQVERGGPAIALRCGKLQDVVGTGGAGKPVAERAGGRGIEGIAEPRIELCRIGLCHVRLCRVQVHHGRGSSP